MNRLRNSILYLVFHLAIFFNIDRLDLAGQDPLNLEKAVFVLTVLVVAMILSIQWLKTLRPSMLLLLSTGAYFVAKLILISRRPLIGGIYTYLSFMELGLFLIAVMLARTVALNVEAFNEALENFAFASIFKIKRVQEAQRDIEAEMYRSRRFRRPLSIIVLDQQSRGGKPKFNKLVQDAQRALMKHYVSAMIVKELSAQLRQTDILLAHDKKGRLIILSPDTDNGGAEAFIGRLRTATQDAAFSVKFGAATLPNQALTFEQLLECAETDLQRRVDGLPSMELLEKPAAPTEEVSESVGALKKE